MKISYTLLGLVLLVSAGCKKSTDNSTDYTQALNDMVAQKWQAFQQGKPANPGGVGIYYMKGSTVYAACYNLPGDLFTTLHFRAASTTKSYTAAAILLLEQQGKLNIDDSITALIPGGTSPYIPDDANFDIPHKNKITIRMLLDNRAGVFDVANDVIPDTVQAPYAGRSYLSYLLETQGGDHTITCNEMARVVALHHLCYFPPDSAFHYSNTGYAILGEIIKRVSGLPFQEFIRVSFFDPLQLGESQMVAFGGDTTLPYPTVDSYVRSGQDIIKVTGNNLSGAVASGDLVTTPRELARWASLLYTGQSGLNAAQVQKMTTFIPTGEEHVQYGLGCEGAPADLGYGHNGAYMAYMTVMRYLPASGTVIIVVTNYLDNDEFLAEADVLYAIARETLKITAAK